MSEGVVDPLEVVEVEVQHREQPVLLLRCLQGADQAVARLLAVGEPGEGIEVGEPHDAPLGAPFAAERNGHLAHFVRMKWLLQIGELVFRRHVAADLARIRVRVRRADHDLERGIELADVRRRPHPILPGGHAHVDESHREGLVARKRLFHGYDRLGRLLAKHGLEARGPCGRLPQRLLRILAEQAAAQLVKAGHLEVGLGITEDLLVGVADFRLVIHDQYPNRRVAFSHEDLRWLLPERFHGRRAAPADAAQRRAPGPRWRPRSARRERRWRWRTSAGRSRDWFPGIWW